MPDKRPFVLDMETSDPDDFLTLLLLLGHPKVDLRAVTVTPGTREQVGIVRWVLRQFQSEIPVGAYNIDHGKNCVSEWHYKAYGMPKTEEDADPGWKILAEFLGPETTLVTGAPLKNLGHLLTQTEDTPLGRIVVQGGFAGEGVVPAEKQLRKFRGMTTCPSFNLNGDPKSVQRLLDARSRFSDVRFVSKNVCHGVLYEETMHEWMSNRVCGEHVLCDCLCHHGERVLHVVPCCEPCGFCGQERVLGHLQVRDAGMLSRALIYRGMQHYLLKKPSGKALHDPLAACCAIDPEIGEWAEVEIYRERGEWGSYLAPNSGVKIIVGYNLERFLQVFGGH